MYLANFVCAIGSGLKYENLRNLLENTVQLDIESVSATLKVKSNTASEWPTHHQHRPLMCLDGEVRRQGGR